MITTDVNGNALTTAFYDKINSFSRHFELKLTDDSTGNDLDLTYKKANFHRGSCGGSSFAVGCAFCASIEVTAVYDASVLEGTIVRASIGTLMDDGTYVWVKIGKFMIQKPVKENDMMVFTAVDAMLYAFTGKYVSSLNYPATVGQIVSELSTTYGITITGRTSAISACTLQTPISVTHPRSVIQTLATLCLGYAYIDVDGNLVFASFGQNGTTVSLDFDLVKTQPVMDERATVTDGIRIQASDATSEEEQTLFEYPTGGGAVHTITVGCPYMTQEIFDIVKTTFTTFTYNGGEVRFMGNPLIEPCDRLTFKGNSDVIIYNVITDDDKDIETENNYLVGAEDYVVFDMACMEIDYEFDGGLTTTVTAPGSFEKTEESTQPGVLAQISALEESSGQNVSQLIAGARYAANEAQTIAENTNQYFWHTTIDDGTGVGTGAHITEVPQAQFVRDPENGGGNLLARSNGIAVRKGLTELAQFAADFIRMYNSQEIPIFDASKAGTETSRVVEMVQDVAANTTVEIILNRPIGQGEEITLFGIRTTGGFNIYSFNGDTPISGDLYPSTSTFSYDGARTITVNAAVDYKYVLAACEPDVEVPYYTIGTRVDSPGGYSTVIGQALSATGDDQVVIGRYNEDDPDCAFIIGNGSGEYDPTGTTPFKRSNAFTVDWDGNITAGNHMLGCIEKGASDGWLYYKYDDGTFDAYTRVSTPILSYATSGGFNAYYYDATFPSACVPANSSYQVFHNWQIGTGFSMAAGTMQTTTSGFRVYGLGSASSGSQTCVIYIHVRGYYS